MSNLLEVRGLSLALRSGGAPLVQNVDFDVAPGEVVGIVGESGSGKTLATRALISLLPAAIVRTAGSVRYKGADVTGLGSRDLRRLRGKEVGFVFQEPMTSLNPSMKIGRQLEEGLVLHTPMTPSDRKAAIAKMLERVGIRDPAAAISAFPHEFSGGMRQRIMLASVMLLQPALLIADEPTTALDAVVQRDVMELMIDLTRAQKTAVLLISHDLPMVARYTKRIIVMEKGNVVEQGDATALLSDPQHPYTRKLLSSLPFRVAARSIDRTGVPVVSVRNVVVEYPAGLSILRKRQGKRVLHGISIDIHEGEIVALVGGSGSGKTTLGRTIAGMLPENVGTITFAGRPRADNWRFYRMNCQMVFQDPYGSLDPRLSVVALVEESLRLVPNLGRAARRARALKTLDEVGLGSEYASRFPHELSGGQRQRVAIARAIARRPRFLIADEPVSALDVTVRAQVLALFADLQKRYGFSCLFISHDLGVVEQVADRVVVMKDGRIVEEGQRDAIFDAPQSPYTRRLLSAIPALGQNATGGVTMRWRFQNEESSVHLDSEIS